MNVAGCVSVVVPVYDAGPFLVGALGSVLLQGDIVGEVIVVDDGSATPVAPILSQFGTRVRLLTQSNRGPAAARNTGLSIVRGRYVAFLDADDTWAPGVISSAVARLEARAELDGLHGLTQLMIHDSQQVEAGDKPIGAPWRSPQLGSLLLRAKTLTRTGGFDPALRFGEDLDWIVRARDAGVQLDPLDEVVLFYRLHGQNMTANLNAVERHTLHVLKRALDRRRASSEGGHPC